MKKYSGFLWIMAMILITLGGPLRSTSAQASDLDRFLQVYRCGFGQRLGDKIMGVRLSRVSGNVMSFVVDVSVDPAHYNNSDGIARPGGRLKKVVVEVLALDGNGNNLSASIMPGRAGLVGTSAVPSGVTLASPQAMSRLVNLLVMVREGDNRNGFSFCTVWKYANIYTGGASSRPTAPPPNVPRPAPPPTRPQVAQDRGDGYNYRPPVVSIVACRYVANQSQSSPGPPRCMGRGGGRNGFWGQEAVILIHFKGLPIGSHKLRVSVQGSNRAGKRVNAGSYSETFKNTYTGCWYWFRSRHILGKDYSSITLSFVLDRYGYVGSIDVTGSFE